MEVYRVSWKRWILLILNRWRVFITCTVLYYNVFPIKKKKTVTNYVSYAFNIQGESFFFVSGRSSLSCAIVIAPRPWILCRLYDVVIHLDDVFCRTHFIIKSMRSKTTCLSSWSFPHSHPSSSAKPRFFLVRPPHPIALIRFFTVRPAGRTPREHFAFMFCFFVFFFWTIFLGILAILWQIAAIGCALRSVFRHFCSCSAENIIYTH